MNPEVAKKWEEALQAYREAEHCLRAGEHDQANREAWQATRLGIETMMALFPSEKEQHDVGVFAVFADAWEARERPGLSSNDQVEMAKTVLMRYIHLSPPENKLWGESQL